MAFSPDGRHVLSGSSDKSLKLWDTSTGQLLQTFEGNSAWVYSVAFSPDGRWVLSGSNTVKIWDAATGQVVRTLNGHANRVQTVAFSPDGRQVLSGSWDKTIKLWDASTGLVIRSFEGRTAVVQSVAFSPNGRQIVSARDDYSIKLWDSVTGQVLHTFKGHIGPVLSAAFSPDGRQILSGSADAKVKLWDAATGKLIRTFEDHLTQVYAVVLSADGKLALSASNDRKLLWETATAKVLRTFEGQDVRSVAISPDGRHVVLASDILNLWDAATGKLVRTFTGHRGGVEAVVFSPDGRQVLTGGWDRTVKLWDVATGKLVRTLDVGGRWWVSSVAFSPDGRKLLSNGSDATAKLWDVATGQLMRTFEGHTMRVNSVAFSPDGKWIVSGSDDTTSRLWRTETGEHLTSFVAARDGEWLAITREGFFNASSPKAAQLLAVVRGLDAYGVDQMWQSLYAPDLVREKSSLDGGGEVARAAQVIDLDKVVDSGKAPRVAVTSPALGTKSADEIVTAEAPITEQERGGIGRIEWRVNGITVGVDNSAAGSDRALTVKQMLALDPGENTIEVVAYNGSNLLASPPVRATVTWTGTITEKPRLHVLAIGINKYTDKGGIAPGETESRHFPPLALAVPDAKALAEKLKSAGDGLYGEVRARTVLDEEATAANLDAVVTQMAKDIAPRDTFVLYAATHGYSHQGRFYLIPQDYQGGLDPKALAAGAIDQLKLQEWIANRIRAKKALILLDSCESGALTAGYSRSRFDGPASDAAIGRLHEATGRPVLTAAGLGQAALELSELGHESFHVRAHRFLLSRRCKPRWGGLGCRACHACAGDGAEAR